MRKLQGAVVLGLAVAVFVFSGCRQTPEISGSKWLAAGVDQVAIAEAPYHFTPTDVFWLADTDRGYDAAFASVSPDDPTKGSRLVTYDFPMHKCVVLLDDISSVCKPSGAVQRITAVGGYGSSFLLGTSPATSVKAKDYPGGHVVEFNSATGEFNDFGVIEAGASAVSIYDDYDFCTYILVRTPDGVKYHLYEYQDSFKFTGVEGGPELRGFYVAPDGSVYYRGTTGQLMVLSPGLRQKPRDVGAKPDDPQVAGLLMRTRGDYVSLGQRSGYREFLPMTRRFRRGGGGANAPSLPEFGVLTASHTLVGLHQLAEYPWLEVAYVDDKLMQGADTNDAAQFQGIVEFVNSYSGTDTAKAVLSKAAWRDGVVYVAKPQKHAHLYEGLPAVRVVGDLGRAPAREGEVLALRVDPRCDLWSVRQRGTKTYCTWQRSPLFDEFIVRRNEAAQADWKTMLPAPILAKTIASLFRFGDWHDRSYLNMMTAADGNVYFGSMPHHPTQSTDIWRCDTRTGKLTDFGSFDVITRNIGENLVASMMHTRPFNMNGKIYFAGQDPFYGNRLFPGWPKDVHYSGSHVLSYDLKSGAFENLGVPFPNDESVFDIMGDAQRNRLFLKVGYSSNHWNVMDLATKKTRDMGVRPSNPHIGADGKFYFTTAEGRVMRTDPDTLKTDEIGHFNAYEVSGITPNPRERRRTPGIVIFLPECCGQKEAIGFIDWCGTVVKLDTETGKVTPIGQIIPHELLGGRNLVFALAAGNGKMYAMLIYQPLNATRITQLFSLDLATGKSRDLGAMRDERGRLIETVNCMSIGGDGKLYFQATVYCKPGDRLYSYRIEPEIHAVVDTCFMVIDPAKIK